VSAAGASTGLVESRSPQQPSDVVASEPAVEPAAVRAVYDAAFAARREREAAGPLGRAHTLGEAASALEAASEELVALGVREVGKPIGEMAGEVTRGVAILRYDAAGCLDPDGETLPTAGNALLLARRRPHGVTGCITPWNFPVAIPLWKLAPALAYGNAVLLEPAPAATASALRLGELLGPLLPTGLLAVLPGEAATGQAVLSTVDALSFTGSAAVGASLAAEAVRRGIPVQAEMGGQNPSVVLEDADHEAAAAVIGGAAEVVEAGGQVLAGGRRLPGAGFFVSPTIVAGIESSQRSAQEEIFGPFVSILAARDAEDAIAIANGVRYGLAAAVSTRDLDRALALVPRLQAGLVRVNAPTSGVDLYAPFGGVEDSSIGPREQGKAARDFFTWTQTVTISPAGGR